jgi:hypothetical protein
VLDKPNLKTILPSNSNQLHQYLNDFKSDQLLILSNGRIKDYIKWLQPKTIFSQIIQTMYYISKSTTNSHTYDILLFIFIFNTLIFRKKNSNNLKFNRKTNKIWRKIIYATNQIRHSSFPVCFLLFFWLQNSKACWNVHTSH